MASHRARKEEFNRLYFCSDDEFVAACGLTSGTRDAEVALHVRRIVAELAGVQSESVLPNHTFIGDLVAIDATLDSLDAVDYTMRLEERLRQRLPAHARERLPGTLDLERLDPSFTVGNMCVETARMVREMFRDE